MSTLVLGCFLCLFLSFKLSLRLALFFRLSLALLHSTNLEMALGKLCPFINFNWFPESFQINEDKLMHLAPFYTNKFILSNYSRTQIDLNWIQLALERNQTSEVVWQQRKIVCPTNFVALEWLNYQLAYVGLPIYPADSTELTMPPRQSIHCDSYFIDFHLCHMHRYGLNCIDMELRSRRKLFAFVSKKIRKEYSTIICKYSSYFFRLHSWNERH